MLGTIHPRFVGGRPVGNEFALRPTAEAVATGAGRVQRDSNADGRFTAADLNGVQDLNNTFKIHRGSVRDNTDSAGCQTISGTHYDAFIAEIRRNPGQHRWQYVLTSVDPDLQPQQEREPQDADRAISPRAPGGAPAAQPRHPADPEHPDHDLHRQIRERVGALDPGFQQDNDQLSMSLLAEAKAQGLSRVDHLIPNQATAHLKPGEHLFLVQGRIDDPAMHRAMVNTAAANGTPVEESLSRIDHLNHMVSHAPVVDPQQRNATQDATSIPWDDLAVQGREPMRTYPLLFSLSLLAACSSIPAPVAQASGA